MNQRVKLDDVAEKAGVSKTTVSRVLNHRGYLSDQTIKKVHQAMEELHYRPNVVARHLYHQKTNQVGLVFPTVNDPFFSQLESRLAHELYERGYASLMGNSQNNPDKERRFLNYLLDGQIDGLIVGAHNQGLSEYQETNLPIVSIERWVAPKIPIVASDNYAGGIMATQRLLDDGCQNIIHTNYPRLESSTNQRRQQAYEDLMIQHNRQPITYEVNFDSTVEEKLAVFKKLFDEHPEVDGIVADNDTNASLIIHLAKDLGYSVPDQLKVIGFDGADTTQILMPELTTIKQPIDDLATTAVDLLVKRINGEENVASVILPVTLHEGTTA